DRLAHGLEAGEVNDGLEVDVVQSGGRLRTVGQVGIDHGDVPAGEHLDTVECLTAAVGEVVEDDDVVGALEQHESDMGSDVSGSAGEKNAHDTSVAGVSPPGWRTAQQRSVL